MLIWLKKYWPALILIAFGIAILDATFSSLMTCHPITQEPNGSTDAEKAKEYCTALNGPVLVTLRWLAHIAHKYEGLITAAFTLVLAAFTGRLWYSTEKLWNVTNQSIAVARDDFNATHRPWIPITKVTLNFGLKWAVGNAIIGISVFCKNTGNSPASRVSLATVIFPFLPNNEIPIEIEKLKKSHTTLETRQIIERPLFPNTSADLVLSGTLIISDKKIADLKDSYGKPMNEAVPVILGAVEYYFTFGDQTPHYTPFVYHLWRTDTEGVARKTVILDGTNVEANEMILVDLINAGDPT